MSGKGNLKTQPQEDQPLNLSVCILAHEHRLSLDRCVSSIEGIATQIVIVDTRTRDGLCQHAASAKTTVITKRACASLSNLRNSGLEACTGEWILCLDCDEWLDEDATKLIQDVLSCPKADGFVLWARHTTHFDCSTESLHRRGCRLFRNDRRIRFDRFTTESVEQSIDAIGGVILGTNTIAIHNDGHAQWDSAGFSEVSRSISQLKKKLQKFPSDPGLYFEIGLNFYEIKNHYQAQVALVQACDLVELSSPLAPPIYSLLAVVYRELGAPDVGIALGGRLEEAGLATAELLFAMGWACLGADRFREAADYFARADSLAQLQSQGRHGCDPSIAKHRALMGRALSLLEIGDSIGALSCAKRAAKRAPDLAEPLVLLACCHQTQGDIRKACTMISKAISIHPSHETGAALAVQLFVQTGRLSEALDVAKRILTHHPAALRLRLSVAEILAKQGKIKEAVEAVGVALQMAGNSPEAFLGAAHIYLACSDYQSAFGAYKRAITLDPSNPTAYFGAADTLFQIGAFGQAAQMYSHALERDPLNAEGFFAAGNACLKYGRLELAVRSWEKAVQIKPDFQEAHHNLRIAKQTLSRAA
ncbi:MAG: tetratricopeptide repeat protein [Armatimonadota bacterium]